MNSNHELSRAPRDRQMADRPCPRDDSFIIRLFRKAHARKGFRIASGVPLFLEQGGVQSKR